MFFGSRYVTLSCGHVNLAWYCAYFTVFFVPLWDFKRETCYIFAVFKIPKSCSRFFCQFLKLVQFFLRQCQKPAPALNASNPNVKTTKKQVFFTVCSCLSAFGVWADHFSIHTQKLRFAKCVLTAMCAFQCQKQETKFLPHLSFFRVHIFHIDPLSSQHTAAQHAHEQWVLADLSVRDWGAQWWLLLAIETKVVSIIKYYTYYTNNNYKCIYIYIYQLIHNWNCAPTQGGFKFALALWIWNTLLSKRIFVATVSKHSLGSIDPVYFHISPWWDVATRKSFRFAWETAQLFKRWATKPIFSGVNTIFHQVCWIEMFKFQVSNASSLMGYRSPLNLGSRAACQLRVAIHISAQCWWINLQLLSMMDT